MPKKDFSYIHIYIYGIAQYAKHFTNIQDRDQVPNNQYSAVYTVLQNSAGTNGEMKTPLSLSLAGSEPRSEAQWLA